MSFDSRKTPYYLIDLKKIKENYENFIEAIISKGRNDIIAYSVKANYNSAIIKQLNDLGAYFEVCSAYEYHLIVSEGVKPSHIIINGCFFYDFSLYRDSILVLDTYAQLFKWVQEGCERKIGIRVNLDCLTVDERFKNQKSRFGIKMHSSEAKALMKKVNLNNIICLHCHLAGNNRDPSIYSDVIIQLQKICDNFHLNKVKYFDIGGGYKVDLENHFWNFSDYVSAVHEVCKKEIQIIFEPGNSLVRNCAEYHTKIIAAKKLGEEGIFVVDGSSLHIPNVDFSKTGFRIEHCGIGKDQYSGNKIFGNTCKESDLLLKFDNNTFIRLGDNLVIENIGAYSLNEVNSLILGVPDVYFSNYGKHLIGNHIFTYLCEYQDCYKKGGRNSYLIIRKRATKKGLYAFVSKNGEIIYIGVAYDRAIYKRVVQHFRNDTGGLRKKLSQPCIKELEDSYLYVCEINDTKQRLLYEEAYLIGLYKPKFNFL